MKPPAWQGGLPAGALPGRGCAQGEWRKLTASLPGPGALLALKDCREPHKPARRGASGDTAGRAEPAAAGCALRGPGVRRFQAQPPPGPLPSPLAPPGPASPALTAPHRQTRNRHSLPGTMSGRRRPQFKKRAAALSEPPIGCQAASAQASL